MKKVVVYALCIYAMILAVTFAYLVMGMINYFTTLAFYSTFIFVSILLLWLLKEKGVISKRFNELVLFVSTLFIFLCIADLGIRYVLRPETVLNYMEQNGSPYYTSLSLYQKFNFINKHLGRKYLVDWFHLNKPNTQHFTAKPDFAFTSTFNGEGLRNAEVTLNKAKNEIRLIALGDSYTEGIGAPGDSTWPLLLGNLLNQERGDKFFNVINAGASGSDPFFEYRLLKYRLLKYKPQIVMVAINASDIDDVKARGGDERFMPDTTIRVKDSPWWEPVYGCSMLFRMYVQSVCHYDYMLMPEIRGPALRREAIYKLATAIDKFEQLARENDFILVIILHPVLNEVLTHHFELEELQNVAAAKHDVIVINLFNEYQNYFTAHRARPVDYYWPRDFHHNPAGYQLWSQLVYQKLMQEKIPGL